MVIEIKQYYQPRQWLEFRIERRQSLFFLYPNIIYNISITGI